MKITHASSTFHRNLKAIQEVIKKVTMESLQNQFSKTAAVVREIQISQKTYLTHT